MSIPAGWTLIVLGLALGPLPGPGGIPVIALGVVILLRNSQWARRRFIRLRRRYPKMLAPVETFVRRKKRNQQNGDSQQNGGSQETGDPKR